MNYSITTKFCAEFFKSNDLLRFLEIKYCPIDLSDPTKDKVPSINFS